MSGNSNWFIFAILVMYIVTYVCSLINKGKINKKTNLFITILSMAYMIIMSFIKETYWFNTILCYSAGLWYAAYKNRIDNILKTKYLYVVIPSFIFFIVLYLFSRYIIIYELLSVIFCLLIIFITYKIKIENKALIFLGKYSFEIYILQRIPFIIYKQYFVNNIYIYYVISLITTILISILFKRVTKILDKYIKRIEKNEQ